MTAEVKLMADSAVFRITIGLQLKQSNQTLTEYRKEKNQLKKQLLTCQNTIEQQEQTIKSQEITADKSLLNAKCLSIDERIETEKKFEEFNKLIQQLNDKLNEEKLNRNMIIFL